MRENAPKPPQKHPERVRGAEMHRKREKRVRKVTERDRTGAYTTPAQKARREAKKGEECAPIRDGARTAGEPPEEVAGDRAPGM